MNMGSDQKSAFPYVTLPALPVFPDNSRFVQSGYLLPLRLLTCKFCTLHPSPQPSIPGRGLCSCIMGTRMQFLHQLSAQPELLLICAAGEREGNKEGQGVFGYANGVESFKDR